MIGNCDLCKKIWDNVDEYQAQFKYDWDEEIAIVMKNDEPWLYIPIEGDSYYSDTYLQLNFCPKCGRQINPKYKAMR